MLCLPFRKPGRCGLQLGREPFEGVLVRCFQIRELLLEGRSGGCRLRDQPLEFLLTTRSGSAIRRAALVGELSGRLGVGKLAFQRCPRIAGFSQHCREFLFAAGEVVGCGCCLGGAQLPDLFEGRGRIAELLGERVTGARDLGDGSRVFGLAASQVAGGQSRFRLALFLGAFERGVRFRELLFEGVTRRIGGCQPCVEMGLTLGEVLGRRPQLRRVPIFEGTPGRLRLGKLPFEDFPCGCLPEETGFKSRLKIRWQPPARSTPAVRPAGGRLRRRSP